MANSKSDGGASHKVVTQGEGSTLLQTEKGDVTVPIQTDHINSKQASHKQINSGYTTTEDIFSHVFITKSLKYIFFFSKNIGTFFMQNKCIKYIFISLK